MARTPLAANSEKSASDKKPRGPGKRFAKGESGNPNGRPKKTEEEFELERACAEKCPEALETILDLMKFSESDKVRMGAAAFIIERKYGKALQRQEVRSGPLEGVADDTLDKLIVQKAKEAGVRLH